MERPRPIITLEIVRSLSHGVWLGNGSFAGRRGGAMQVGNLRLAHVAFEAMNYAVVGG
jgi:hypothetical protein